jgi:hypothetical protein
VSGRPPAVDAGWPGEALAGILSAAGGSGTPGAPEALASLSTARRLASELELGELALIEAARDGGATWSQISAALGTRNRQTAQKRHADLSRRHPRPPAVDRPPDASCPAVAPPARDGDPPGTAKPVPAAEADPGPSARGPASPPPAPGKPAAPGRRPAVPKITGAIIAEGLYELVRAPDHAETRAWHVLVAGVTAGLVRPTWHGELSRPGWEPVDLSGLALPVRGTGRVTPAGNARTRDAAAVSLLRALQRQRQEEAKEKKRHAADGQRAQPGRRQPDARDHPARPGSPVPGPVPAVPAQVGDRLR